MVGMVSVNVLLWITKILDESLIKRINSVNGIYAYHFIRLCMLVTACVCGLTIMR
jgi:hypothetical protein